MDLRSAIIALVLLALFIGPLFYYRMAQKKKRNNFFKELTKLAEQEKVNFSQHDVWGLYYGLGLDNSTHKLFYFKKRDGREKKVLIDLNEVEKCRVNNINRTVNDTRVIDRLELVFIYRNARLPEVILEFYDNEESMSLNDELHLTEKWKTIINSSLKAEKEYS